MPIQALLCGVGLLIFMFYPLILAYIECKFGSRIDQYIDSLLERFDDENNCL